MAYVWPAKDPNEVLDYEHDWGPRLAGDTVSGPPLCLIETGTVVVDSSVMVANVQKVWLSAGTVGDVRLTLRVNTVGGRILDEGIKLKIKER
jgi:hypothetical protein